MPGTRPWPVSHRICWNWPPDPDWRLWLQEIGVPCSHVPDPAQYLSDVVDAVLDMPGLEGHHLVVQPQPGAGLEYTFGLLTSDR